MVQPTITLSNGIEMPQIAFGFFQIPPGDATYKATLAALKAGYRKIDTAHAYFNERDVAKAVKDSGIPRKEIWITSKLWPTEYGEGKTFPAIERMLKRLGTDYLDLIYLHQADGDYLGAWKDLEKAYEQKKVRAIGISNFDFTDELWNSIVETARIKPHMTQVELHPYFQRRHLRELCAKYNIKIDCYYPVGGRGSGGSLLKHPVIGKIAESHHRSPAQILLRWHVQQGLSPLPGSTNPEHIAENLRIFDFELTEPEMEQIAALDKNTRLSGITHADIPGIIKQFPVQDD